MSDGPTLTLLPSVPAWGGLIALGVAGIVGGMALAANFNFNRGSRRRCRRRDVTHADADAQRRTLGAAHDFVDDREVRRARMRSEPLVKPATVAVKCA